MNHFDYNKVNGKEIEWPSRVLNRSETKPKNIVGKIPMKKIVFTKENDYYEYYFDGKEIKWTFLYSAFEMPTGEKEKNNWKKYLKNEKTRNYDTKTA